MPGKALSGVLFVEYDSIPYERPPVGSRRVCVTGGRDFTEEAFIRDYLDAAHAEQVIYQLGAGCARGLDRIALQWAKDNSVRWKRYAADWPGLGKAAGAIRNGVMLRDFKPDLLFVFPGGVGTTNCARQARKLGIFREFIDHEGYWDAH